MPFVRSGVRYAKMQTYPHSYGEGKVHLLYWDSLNKQWRISCCDKLELDYHAHRVDDTVEVTCKKCPKG